MSVKLPKKNIEQATSDLIDLSLIRQSPHQHRTGLPGLPLDTPFSELPSSIVEGPSGLRELAASIANVGPLSPVRLRSQSDGTYLLIDGECRVRAHHHLGRQTIAALVGNMDEVSAALATADGNLKRRDIRPLEEAHAYKMILEACGGSATVAAKRVGVGVDLFRRRLCLLDLSASWRAANEDNRSPVHGWGPVALETIARMPEASQEQLWLLYRGRLLAKPSGAQVEEMCAAVMHELSSAPFDTKSENLIEGEGPCHKCPRRTGADAPLFSEIRAGEDHCLDASCWQKKTAAMISEKIKSAPSPVYLISTLGAKVAPDVVGADNADLVAAIVPEVAFPVLVFADLAFSDLIADKSNGEVLAIFLDGLRAGKSGFGHLASFARDTAGKLLRPSSPEDAQASRRARRWLRMWQQAVAAHISLGEVTLDEPAMIISGRLENLPLSAVSALAVSYGSTAVPHAIATTEEDLTDYAPAAHNPILEELGAVRSPIADFLCGPVRKLRGKDFSNMLFNSVMAALHVRIYGYLANRNMLRLGVTEIAALESLIDRSTPGEPLRSWDLLEVEKEKEDKAK